MKEILNQWRNDKLKLALEISWLITVFSSFFGSVFSLTYLPGIGALYPFRIFLPVTVMLYLVWAIQNKHNPWKQASPVQRLCYVLCILLIVYGGLSLFWAMDRGFTFRRWFNLCIDLCFFFLALEFGKDQRVFIYAIRCTIPAVLIQLVMGIFEVFSGGIFFSHRDAYYGITFFGKKCHWPFGSAENPNDYAMMLVLMLALYLLYWVWRRHKEKCDWIPVVLIMPVYFLIRAGEARLCTVAFLTVIVGFLLYGLTLERKKNWILILTILLLGFVTFAINYEEFMTASDEGILSVLEPMTVSAEAAPIETEKVVSLSAKPSLKDEFFAVDKKTGELRLNQYRSAGIRLALLMHAWDCFVQSKGMGVGLGNAEQLTKLGEVRLKSDMWNIHCFLARMVADFGIWFLIPLLLIVVVLLRNCFRCMYQMFKEKKASNVMMWFLYLTVLISYPIASTAPAEAQDCLAMWFFLAGIVLFPMHMQKSEREIME